MMIVRRYSVLARRRHPFARSRGSRSFIVSRRPGKIVRCLASCVIDCSRFVVAWALSLVVCCRMCVVIRLSSVLTRCVLSSVHLSFVVARVLSSFVRVGEYHDPSLCLIVIGRSFGISRRVLIDYSWSLRRCLSSPSSLFVIVHHSSCAIARALSSSVRWLVCIVIVCCVCRLPRSILHSGFLCRVVV